MSFEHDMARARAAVAAQADLEKIDDTLFIEDFCVCKRDLYVEREPVYSTGASHDPADYEGGAAFLAFAPILQRKLETREVANQATLAREYAVEKDFRTIKEVIKLRPVFHHADPKVRAHVTLCMLGLLLERTLEQRLKRTGAPLTTPACLEQLRSCHLNLLRAAPELDPSYQLTELTAEPREILSSLRLLDLIDHEALQTRLRPREADRS